MRAAWLSSNKRRCGAIGPVPRLCRIKDEGRFDRSKRSSNVTITRGTTRGTGSSVGASKPGDSRRERPAAWPSGGCRSVGCPTVKGGQ